MTAPGAAPDPTDVAVVEAQLGRFPRGMMMVAHRCSCGQPDVVQTAPFLPDGTPFPTLFYLTCPRAASAIGTLEASGLMRDMTERLATEPELAADYQQAHEAYLAERDAIGVLPKRVSAGGMPNRVKCLHVLIAHELARPGSNPLGAEALGLLEDWGRRGPCVTPTAVTEPADQKAAAEQTEQPVPTEPRG